MFWAGLVFYFPGKLVLKKAFTEHEVHMTLAGRTGLDSMVTDRASIRVHSIPRHPADPDVRQVGMQMLAC